MTGVTFEDGAIEVAATLIAESLQVSPERVQDEMRAGRMTSVCERGTDSDAGTFRLSFSLGNRRLRLIIDENGTVLGRSTLTTAELPTG